MSTVPPPPQPTSLPPPAITNPLPQSTVTSPASSATSPHTSAPAASPPASTTVTNSTLTPPPPATTAAAPSAAAPAVDAGHPLKEAKEKEKDVKVSNVPSVFIAPEYINKPADYRPDIEAAAPPAERVRLQGSTDVSVPHLYDASQPPITVAISNDDLQFQLKPGYLLPPASSWSSSSPPAPIVYLNAQDTSFYRQLLPSPRFTLWIVIKNTSFILNTSNNVGYVKRRLVEECLRVNVQCLLLNPNEFDLAVSRSGVSSVIYRGQQIPLPAAVIPRVGANVDYFGLAVLRQLEALGVRVFNPVNAIEISRDKLYTHQVLSSNGLPIPRTCLSRFPFEYDYIERHFSYPIIVKLASGSRGEAVWKVQDREEVAKLMETVDRSRPIIVQEFIAETMGRDLRCLVVGDAVVASCMRLSSPSSFKANYHAGGSTLPISISAELQAMVVKASQLCGLSFSGVDVLIGKDGYLLCEVNSSPGFEGLERATGVNCGKAMLDWAEREVEKGRQQQPQQDGTARAGWRLREKEYPLQDDHMQIIMDVQRKERERAEEEAEMKRKQQQQQQQADDGKKDTQPVSVH